MEIEGTHAAGYLLEKAKPFKYSLDIYSIQ